MIIEIMPQHSFVYDGAQLKVFHANAGEGLSKHEHVYAHATLCHAGSCKVSLEGRSYTMTKDSKPLNLPAGEWHEIEALENDTVFVNVFAEGKQ